ncbi:MAG: ribonuclease HII [Myxococcales bacterium]|nr:ribonuclease HII [Myxococcales bacterium]
MARRSAPESLPLAKLRQRYLADGRSVPRHVLAQLEDDERQGAQALLKALRSRQADNRAEGQRLRHMLKFETALWGEGHVHIAGVDEAGMAPLAGPICAGAAILPRGYKLKDLDDSKKILDEAKRDDLAAAVKRDAVAWAIGWASLEDIDSLNIYHAGLLAMRRAVEGLAVPPDYVLVDARKIPGIPQPQRGIIKGDAQSLSIAAGAILAKTSRDHLLHEWDEKYPGYGFASHKGYPTPEHLDAIARLGVLEIHRKSFTPIKKALGLIPEQEELFELAPAKKAARR